jgi:acyl-CoA synthetase (AMP-forming)/AMP-acid ligase II
MILGEPDRASAGGTRATLDGIFRRAAVRRPQAVALIDPLNRARVTDGEPRQFTYAEVDRLISAIAGRLHRLGLQTDAVVAMQLPNTVESVLTLLGVLRAGMIAAPLPLLWRKQDAISALGRIGAKVFITSARIGTADHCDIAMQVAADLFPIRYVCAFGNNLPDGVVPLDDIFALNTLDALPLVERIGNPATHVAAVTFDVAAEGLVPMARSHLQLIAGGLAPFLEGGIAQNICLLSTIPLSSFAGIALTLMPWLLSGGTLVLHHPFDADSFAQQRNTHPCDTVVVPGPLLARLAESGHLSGDELKTVIALWRAPERLSGIAPWRNEAKLVDVANFGEAGLLAARRSPGGKPASIPYGAIAAPRGTPNAVMVAETACTETGTLALRGTMVPSHAFPPGAERGTEFIPKRDRDGFVDTGYTCRFERDTRARALAVTGPPAGVAGVGGYCFLLRDVDALVESLAGGAIIAALPNALMGHRLAGNAPDRAAIVRQLTEHGINPLIAGAFRPRGQANAA